MKNDVGEGIWLKQSEGKQKELEEMKSKAISNTS